MRVWTTALFALAFASEAAAVGAYASHTAQTPEACARICADDGLCVAWSLTAEGLCHLRATTPEAPAGIASGFSQRAPAALRQAFVNLAPAAPPITEATPSNSETAASMQGGHDDGALLGGLEPRGETAELRLGLRN